VEAFDDVDAEALAILESQMLNYRTRSHAILSDASSSVPAPALSRIYATGGAAKNPTICSVMADALGCPVSKTVDWDEQTQAWVNATWNDCSVGVAYKARWGWERHAVRGRENVPFDDLISEIKVRRREEIGDKAVVQGMQGGVHNVATPTAATGAYAKAASWWMELEARALREGN
jgi:xylulokinase